MLSLVRRYEIGTPCGFGSSEIVSSRMYWKIGSLILRFA